MLNAWIIYCEEDALKNKGSIEMFHREFHKHGICSRLLIYEKMNIDKDSDNSIKYEDEELILPDIVVNRTRSYKLACYFEKTVKHLYNCPKLALLGNDKVEATYFARGLGIKTMRIYEQSSDISKWPVVAKTKNGHGGSEVFLVNDLQEAKNLEKEFENVFFQEYSPEGNSDMRVYVVGNSILCAIRRHSEKDFRSNYSLGGTVEEVTVPEPVVEYVTRMIEAIGHVAYCGMDFIKYGDEWVFNEIEDMVGARSVYTYTEHDPIAAFTEYIWRNLNEQVDAEN